MKPAILTASIFLLCGFIAAAQADNEIQVYASPTVGRQLTIIELHSNYTLSPSKRLAYPGEAKDLNESLEITHGFTDNFELGFYVFTTL